jgi:hypothetical protein
MDNTNQSVRVAVPKERRTYDVAGVQCLCWKGGLYAPEAATTVKGAATVVASGPDHVELDNGEVWKLTSREEMKARGVRPARSRSTSGEQRPRVDRGTFVPTGPQTLVEAIAALESLDPVQ